MTRSQRHNESTMLSIAEKKASRLGLKREWAGFGGRWGFHSHADKRRRRSSPRATISPHLPQQEARPDAIAVIGVAISAAITSAHNVLTHAGEIMPKKSDKINPLLPPSTSILFSLPAFVNSQKMIHAAAYIPRHPPPSPNRAARREATTRTSSIVHAALALLWISLKSCVCASNPFKCCFFSGQSNPLTSDPVGQCH